MSKPVLSATHQQMLVDMIRDQRAEIRSLKREIDAVQPYMLWMAMRIHYLETQLFCRKANPCRPG